MDVGQESGSQIRNLGKLAFNKLMNSLDAERTWNEHTGTLSLKNKERHIRLNTPLENPLPELDAVDRIRELEELARNYWAGAGERRRIKALARRMVASSFYFEMAPTESDSLSSGKATGKHTRSPRRQSCLMLAGTIRCRLHSSKHPGVIKHLGEYFDRQSDAAYGTRPAFKIKGSSSGHSVNVTTIKTVRSMFTQQSFELAQTPITIETNDTSSLTEITLAFGQNLDVQFPISGFPRCLF
jgi:hypothetical protein